MMNKLELLNLIISLFSLLVVVVAFVFSVYCLGFTRETISASYRSDIFSWYSKVIEVMVQLKHCSVDKLVKMQLLGRLSALIEEGRFYFFNTLSSNSKELKYENPYQGLRCYMLDYLITYYEIYKYSDSVDISDADKIYRSFTSDIYKFLKPRYYKHKLNKKIKDSYDDIGPRETNNAVLCMLSEIAKKYNVRIL